MRRDERLGITIGTTFGLVYVLVNAGQLPSTVALVLRVVAGLSFVGTQVALQRAVRAPVPEREGPRRRFGRGFGLVVLAEAVALFGGVQVLVRVLDAPEAGVAWVTVVVGVHFVGLAVLWREPSLHVLGGALTLAGVAGLVLAVGDAGEAAVAAVGGVVPGFVLLGGGAWAATQPLRPEVGSSA